MAICKLCFQGCPSGTIVPGYKEPGGMVHEECLAATLKAAEDPLKEGLLRYLIDYEEKHTLSEWAKEVSGGSANVSWEWTDVDSSHQNTSATKRWPCVDSLLDKQFYLLFAGRQGYNRGSARENGRVLSSAD